MTLTHTQQTQIVRVELDDENIVKQLGQKRDMKEYTPSYIEGHSLLLPPSVHRFLYASEAMEDIQKQVQKYLIEDAHIKIIRHELTCASTDGAKICFAPLHVTRSFQYHGIRISGSYFVSLLHNTIATLPECYWNAPWAADLQEVRHPLSHQERQDLIEYYMHSYLKESSSCTDITMISIPSKPAALREKSATHRAFANLAMSYSDNNECVLPMGSSDMYMFAHNNEKDTLEQVQNLFTDPLFIEKMMVFGWSTHILEKLQAISNAEMQLPEFTSLLDQQLFTVLEWVRVTWKNAQGSEAL